MASLGKERGQQVIWVIVNGKRRRIGLEQKYYTEKSANELFDVVEELEFSIENNIPFHMMSVKTQNYLKKASLRTRKKLEKAQLIKESEITTLGKYSDLFLERLVLDKKPNTMDNYRSSFQNMTKYFDKDRQPETVTREEALDYKSWLRTNGRTDGKGGYSADSVKKKLEHVKLLFDEMRKSGFITSNPFDGILQKRNADKKDERKRYIPEEYVLRALEYAPTLEWKLIICLWRYCGLRRNEPLLLKVEDIHFDRRRMFLYASKTNEVREIPIFPSVYKSLEMVYLNAQPGQKFLIMNACSKKYRNTDRMCGMKNANLETIFDKICKKAGLLPISMPGNNLRASAEKDMLTGAKPEYEYLKGRYDLVVDILGHSVEIARKHYSRTKDSDLDDLIASFEKTSPTSVEKNPSANPSSLDWNGMDWSGQREKQKKAAAIKNYGFVRYLPRDTKGVISCPYTL